MIQFCGQNMQWDDEWLPEANRLSYSPKNLKVGWFLVFGLNITCLVQPRKIIDMR